MSLTSDLERDAREARTAQALWERAVNDYAAACARYDWNAAGELRDRIEMCFGVYLDAVAAGYKRLEAEKP